MDKRRYKTNREYYGDLLSRLGPVARAVGWRDTQTAFDIYKKVFCLLEEYNVKSVLDVGCGLGYLGNWLCQVKPKVKYCGLDIVPGFIEYARGNGLNCLSECFSSLSDWAGFDLVAIVHSFDLRIHRRLFRTRIMLEHALRCGKRVAWVGWAAPRIGNETVDIFKYDVEFVVEMCRDMTPYFNLVLFDTRFVAILGDS